MTVKPADITKALRGLVPAPATLSTRTAGPPVGDTEVFEIRLPRPAARNCGLIGNATGRQFAEGYLARRLGGQVQVLGISPASRIGMVRVTITVTRAPAEGWREDRDIPRFGADEHLTEGGTADAR